LCVASNVVVVRNMEEIAFVSGEAGDLLAWNIRTGVILGSYKQNSSGIHSMAYLENSNCLAIAQYNKPAIHTFSLSKEHPLLKSVIPEKLTSLATSKSGEYVVGGSATGKLYMWMTSSGELLSCWPGHFKSVTALAFSDEAVVPNFLVTGGEDGLVHVWLMSSIVSQNVDASAEEETVMKTAGMQPGSKKPTMTLSQHTLPISSVHFSSNRLVTSSLDRTCQVWNLKTPGFEPKLEVRAIFPSVVRSAFLSPSHRNLYAGTADGVIYNIKSLLQGIPVSTDLEASSSSSSSIAVSEPTAFSEGNGSSSSLTSSSGASTSSNIFGQSYTLTDGKFEGHTQPVVSIQLSIDEKYLVSTSLDGTARVWDTKSFQMLRQISNAVPGAPFTSTLLLLLPREVFSDFEARTSSADLSQLQQASGNNAHQSGPKVLVSAADNSRATYLQPIAIFQKFSKPADQTNAFIPVMIRKKSEARDPSNSASSLGLFPDAYGHEDYLGAVYRSNEESLLRLESDAHVLKHCASSSGSVADLERRVAELQESNDRWETLSRQLYSQLASQLVQHPK